jgi:hypothetical protein
MKIGVLVDGDAEFHGLPHVLPRLGSPHQILKPLRCGMQPMAPPGQIALVASKKFPILLDKGAEFIVILIDKETRLDCTGELVQAVEREARARLRNLSPTVDLQVVFKVSMFENWLIADPKAVAGLPGLFEHVERIEKQVSSGRADSVGALDLLRACSKQRGYHKVDGAVAICKGLDPARAAGNSRSFRKLLKVLGCPQGDPAQGTPRQKARR